MLLLSKNSEKYLCYVYKEYLKRRKNNVPDVDARTFSDSFSVKQLKLPASDIELLLQELNSKKYIKRNIIGDFKLSDDAIVYMENRFKNDAKEILDILSNIPFFKR